jgi:hypothetical protein
VITLPTSVLNLLDEGRIGIRGLIRFDFGTGTYGFAKSIVPITYSSLVYQPGGAISVSDLNDDIGMTASQFTVSLSASPDDGLTPEVLQTIEAEDYRDRPVTIYDAYFHPDTNEMLFVQVMKRGYVDTIDHVDTQGVGYTIIANCESRALDYTRINGRKRSDLDQKRRNPGDAFFLFAATRGREQVYWGKENPNSPSVYNPAFLRAAGRLLFK